jgi:RNA polymerase sigma-70 factor (ECF subfamily)
VDAAPFADVLAAAKAGDEDAFRALFRAVQPAVLRYLTVTAGSRAEDIAGETWVQVVRGLRDFVGDDATAFRAWVLSIARHRRLDDLRAQARRPELTAAQPPEAADPVDVESTVTTLVSTEAAIRLIATLPPDQAEVILLRVVADLDVATTAGLLEKKPGAVRVLHHRGLRRLRELLDASTPASV